MIRLVFLAVVAAMAVDVMAVPACPNNIPTGQLRNLPLVQRPVGELLLKVSDERLAAQVFECYTKDGIDCTPCRSGELGQIVALLPVMLQDCQEPNSPVCPQDLRGKAAQVVQKMIESYGQRYASIVQRL